MEKSSNSLLGQAVRSKRDLQSIGNALLEEQKAAPKPTQAEIQNDLGQRESSNQSQHQVAGEQDGLKHAQSQHSSATEQAVKASHAQQSAASDEWVPLLNLRQMLQAVLNAKKLIAITSLCGLLAGVLFALSMPKYFYSTAEILIDPRELQISDRGLLPTGLPYDASLALVENQTRILTSRRVILGTVEKLNLDQDDEFNGKGLGTPNPIEVVQSIIFGRDSDDPAKAKELAVENLQEATSASRTPKTFVINLTIRSQNSEKAALIANTMAAVYIDVQDEIQSDTVGRANGELGGRLEELRSDVEKAERAVEAYRSENELFDANGKLISDDEIALSSTQLTRAREKVAEMRARADSARELTLDAVLSDALPEGAASNLIAELRRGYAAKVQQRDALAEKLGAQHPQLRTAEAEVLSSKRGIETELRRLSQTAQIELQRSIKTEQDLAAGQARLKSKKSSISESLVRLRELEREAGARRSVYESFLLRARETGQQAGISTANTTIVSQAVPPLRTYGTSRKLVAIVGLIGGFMFGLALALLHALWRALTRVEPEFSTSSTRMDFMVHRNQTEPTGSLIPPGGGGRKRVAVDKNDQPAGHDHLPHQNSNHTKGEPMYYPFPAQQFGFSNGNGMVMAPMPQQPMMAPMPQQPMMAPMMQQPMMMHPYSNPYPMMQQQPMVPQMMPHYAYMPQQMMAPVMQQPIIQPVYVAAPQAPAPIQTMASAQPQPAQLPEQPAPAVPSESDYSEIRSRLESLRNGILNLADGRERLAKLG